MRGKVAQFGVTSMVQRITPAYAGKSASALQVSFYLEDHPRLCGEKRYMWLAHINNVGSPPPMRGKVLNHKRDGRTRGITPAYAGKSVALVGVCHEV